MDVLQALVGTVQLGEVWSLPVHLLFCLVGFTGIRLPGLRRLRHGDQHRPQFQGLHTADGPIPGLAGVALSSFLYPLRLTDRFQAGQGLPFHRWPGLNSLALQLAKSSFSETPCG